MPDLLLTEGGFLTGDDYLAQPRDPQPWIIKDLIPVSGLINLYAPPKMGKSFAAIGIAHAVSTGLSSWLGFDVVKHGRVVYLQIDTPRGQWAHRLTKIKLAGYDLQGVYFADTLMAPYPFNILVPEHKAWLKSHLKAINPILVILDTLRELHNGDENDSTVMKNVVSAIVECAGQAAVVLVSHTRKGGLMQGEDLMTDARGSSYIAGRMDTVVKLTKRVMIWQGRSCGEGKKKIAQHEDTGLLILVDPGEELTHLILDTITANPDKSMAWIATNVSENSKNPVSAKTVTRRIKELQDETLLPTPGITPGIPVAA